MSEPYLRSIRHDLPYDVQLWWVDLDASGVLAGRGGLTTSDLERAERMATAQLARRFLASRCAIYHLLAEALGRSPASIALSVNPFGKPELVDGSMHFNLSHSGADALIGLSGSSPIGVDIERIREVENAAEIVRAQFTERERAEWGRASAATRDRAFLECWTRKEACLKALGTGIAVSPMLVETGGADTEPRTVQVAPRGAGAEVTVWSVERSSAAAAVALASLDAVGNVQRAVAGRATFSPPAAPPA
ncbi:MAG TPA: 4'-phosphopantetheinyl transferase superfamily protein [Gemmatimonadales bacterium]|nr:4'-phosphopantetheinyl transferase superfamily protein [Gemmatimonadales bacterium]